MTRSRTPLIILLGSLTAFGPLSIDMYLPGMLAIARDLDASEGAVQLTLASFFLGVTVAQLAYGPLADRYGRRGCLLGGLALYVVASIGCALAPGIEALIALRCLQALGGAAGMVVPRAVVRDLWSGRDAARVLSALMLVMGAAPVLAPTLGGVVVKVAGWRAVFGVLAAFGTMALVVAARSLPETSTPVTATGSLPARYLALLRHRGFLGHALTGGMASAGMFAYIAGSPFVLMDLYGMSSSTYAIVFGINAGGFIAASQINRRLLATRSPRELLDRALPLTAAAALATVLVAALDAGLIPLLVTLFAYIASLGLIGPNAAALALEEQASRAGLASALFGTLQFAGGAVAAGSISLVGGRSAVPMAAVMIACAMLAVAALRGIAGPAAPAGPAASVL